MANTKAVAGFCSGNSINDIASNAKTPHRAGDGFRSTRTSAIDERAAPISPNSASICIGSEWAIPTAVNGAFRTDPIVGKSVKCHSFHGA